MTCESEIVVLVYIIVKNKLGSLTHVIFWSFLFSKPPDVKDTRKTVELHDRQVNLKKAREILALKYIIVSIKFERLDHLELLSLHVSMIIVSIFLHYLCSMSNFEKPA